MISIAECATYSWCWHCWSSKEYYTAHESIDTLPYQCNKIVICAISDEIILQNRKCQTILHVLMKFQDQKRNNSYQNNKNKMLYVHINFPGKNKKLIILCTMHMWLSSKTWLLKNHNGRFGCFQSLKWQNILYCLNVVLYWRSKW